MYFEFIGAEKVETRKVWYKDNFKATTIGRAFLSCFWTLSFISFVMTTHTTSCIFKYTELGRAGSVVSQNSLDRRNSLINESKKKEDIASILERQQSIRSGSDRKSSLASLGQRFSSIVSISSQVAATMAAMSVSEILTNPLPTIEVEPNDLVDKLVPEIMFAASDRFAYSMYNWNCLKHLMTLILHFLFFSFWNIQTKISMNFDSFMKYMEKESYFSLWWKRFLRNVKCKWENSFP